MKAETLLKIFLFVLIVGIIIMGIFHDRVVASRDKGLATDWNADHKIQGNVDFRNYAAVNMLLDGRIAWPPGPSEGQIIWRSDLNLLYIFDGTDWVVHTPAIPKGTFYWSCPGSDFDPYNPATQSHDKHNNIGYIRMNVNSVGISTGVYLPHGAVVTAAVVYGNAAASARNWYLWQGVIADINPRVVMATAKVNTEDNIIVNPNIDNNLYKYHFDVINVVNGDEIYSARITYTL